MAVPRRHSSLAAALGVGRAGLYAFVGAGGKTSAIRRLLEERPQALATTTTHLGGTGYGVGLLVAAADARRLEALERPAGGVRPLTVAGASAGARLVAPPLDYLQAFCARHERDLVFVEADGARRRRVKLPAPHEPAWPPAPLAGAVVVVGTSALGEPARDACHRPAAFVAAGRREARVTVRHLHLMVERYLDRLPPRTPVAVLLTGVAHPGERHVHELVQQAVACVRGRDPRWGASQVPVRCIATPDLSTGPFWTWGWRGPRRSHPVQLPGVCGVLLAAGCGTRFGAVATGGSKLLVRWRGRPLVAHAARTWQAAGFAHLLVVTGHAHARVEAALHQVAGRGAAPRFELVRNPHPERGLGGSVRRAARRAPQGMGLLFGHADMPRLRPATLRRIASLGATLRDRIVVPTLGGQPVHPVYFPASLRRELGRVPDAAGGKPVIAAHRDQVVHLPLEVRRGECVDVDRPADLRRLS